QCGHPKRLVTRGSDIDSSATVKRAQLRVSLRPFQGYTKVPGTDFDLCANWDLWRAYGIIGPHDAHGERMLMLREQRDLLAAFHQLTRSPCATTIRGTRTFRLP